MSIPLEALAYNHFHKQSAELSATFERCNLSTYMLDVIGKNVDPRCRVSPNDGKSHEWFAAMEYFRNGRIRFLFPWKGKQGLVRPVSISTDRKMAEENVAFLCYELLEQMKPYAVYGSAPKAL